jgi:hypothetical protein
VGAAITALFCGFAVVGAGAAVVTAAAKEVRERDNAAAAAIPADRIFFIFILHLENKSVF